MGYSLGLRSRKNLIGVHPDLVRVVKRAIQITSIDFTVIEGLRTEKRQRQLVAQGASKTMNSRHITGHAVDIVPFVGGRIRWDWSLFDPIEIAMKEAARLESVPIELGGDWARLKDGPHWQLPRKSYP